MYHTHTLNVRPSAPCRTVVEGCARVASASFVSQMGVRPVQPWSIISGTCTASPSRHNGCCSTTCPHPQVGNGFRTSLKCNGHGRIQPSHELTPSNLDRIHMLRGGVGRQGRAGPWMGVCRDVQTAASRTGVRPCEPRWGPTARPSVFCEHTDMTLLENASPRRGAVERQTVLCVWVGCGGGGGC